jgi:hypothetical protein
MTDPTLPGFPSPPPPDPRKLSATQRRTLRNEHDLKTGIHPATKLRLANNGETCGTCAHLFAHSRNRTYYKCSIAGITHGAGSDIRLSWPACREWEAS